MQVNYATLAQKACKIDKDVSCQVDAKDLCKDNTTKSANKKSTTTTMMLQQEPQPQEQKNTSAAWKIAVSV
jgi:hypothetical protein